MVELALEATVPVCDPIPAPVNTIQVAPAVKQFLPLQRLQRSSTGWSSMVGSLRDDFSIGTGNSYWILDGGLLEAENIVTSLTVPSSVNKKPACKKPSLLRNSWQKFDIQIMPINNKSILLGFEDCNFVL